MLKDSQEGWRTKVEEKDVTKFTVEGKLNMAGWCCYCTEFSAYKIEHILGIYVHGILCKWA